jgi:hypothetical protein
MSSKARELRRRMSIDPDAPDPVSRPARTRPEPVAEHVPEPEPLPAPEPEPDPEPEPEPVAEAPPEMPALEPAPAPQAAPDTTPEPTPETTTPTARPRPRRRATRKDEPVWTTALDDPAIDADRNGYRSFYVSDAVFARFRAAVYWTARRPDATDVPDNMSTGVEAYMEEVAADLERRYNGGAVFRATPDQLRAHRRREKEKGDGS